jgi:hypothetical protein
MGGKYILDGNSEGNRPLENYRIKWENIVSTE